MIKTGNKSFFFPALVVLLFCLVVLFPTPEGLALDGADVALYNDSTAPPGQAGAWQYGITALKNMLNWIGLTCEEINYTHINSSPQNFSGLYKVILFPGGNAYWYNYWISLAGKERIRDFVAGGGGYFGICAGAYFACDRIVWENQTYDDGLIVAGAYFAGDRTVWENQTYDGAFMDNTYGQRTGYDLDLYPGTGIGPINGIADWETVGYNMTTLDFAINNTVLTGYRYNLPPASEDILYYGGPYFLTDEGAKVESLATYEYNGKTAFVAFRYGAGKVVLCGPHPEIEEDSDRDGITFTEMTRKAEMEDNGSDWELAEDLLKWLIYADKSVDGGDYNGDGTSDLAVFRPSSGLWAIRNLTRVYFGDSSDIPAAGDYNGDGTDEPAVFRPATGLWGIYKNTRIYFGAAGDSAVPGDYDGDGTSETGIFRGGSGLWALRGSTRVYFGTTGDTTAGGDYDGDGSRDIALFRRSSGLWALKNISRFYFGCSHDRLVPGDYDGDGTWEAGIFRPSTGLWAIRKITRCYFGGGSDEPVPGDYDGDSEDDPGIFRDYSGLWALRGMSRIYYGAGGDIPVTR